jgi:hypothetical protein
MVYPFIAPFRDERAFNGHMLTGIDQFVSLHAEGAEYVNSTKPFL